MIIVCDLPFNFEEHSDFITYIWETYNPSFEDFSRSMVKRKSFKFHKKSLSISSYLFWNDGL